MNTAEIKARKNVKKVLLEAAQAMQATNNLLVRRAALEEEIAIEAEIDKLSRKVPDEKAAAA